MTLELYGLQLVFDELLEREIPLEASLLLL